MRPSIARRAGYRTLDEDVLTPDGSTAWLVGMRALSAASPEIGSRFGLRLAQWIRQETEAEPGRWNTMHLLVESLDSRLRVAAPELSWACSVANVKAFTQRVCLGQALLTPGLSSALEKIMVDLGVLADGEHRPSLDLLLDELTLLVEMPCSVTRMDSVSATMVRSDYLEDMTEFLADEPNCGEQVGRLMHRRRGRDRLRLSA